jgi:hypothetical protein
MKTLSRFVTKFTKWKTCGHGGRGSGEAEAGKREKRGSGTGAERGGGTEAGEAGKRDRSEVRGSGTGPGKRDRSDIAKSGDFSACPYCQ